MRWNDHIIWVEVALWAGKGMVGKRHLSDTRHDWSSHRERVQGGPQIETE